MLVAGLMTFDALFATIAPLRDMVGCAGNNDACDASHRGVYGRMGGRIK